MDGLWLYAATGRKLTCYEIDVGSFTLTPRTSILFSANVQYAWPHALKPIIYVATSDRAKPHPGTDHQLSALKIDPQSGALSFHGPSVHLRSRPIHLSADANSACLLVAFNEPSDLEIHRLNEDGSIGGPITQNVPMDTGVFAHQVRVSQDNKLVILVARGMPADGVLPHTRRQKKPGALKVFAYHDGMLGTETSVAPADHDSFGPRHIDFHPTAPWVFVSLETQNKLLVFERVGDQICPQPLFERDTLPHDAQFSQRQQAGTLHVHPSGKFVYCVNRGTTATLIDGRKVLTDAINTFAVFAIDQITAQPTLIQHIDTAGIDARTFSIDPSGTMLVAGNSSNAESRWVQCGDEQCEVAPNLAIFEIRPDGTLRFVRKYECPSDSRENLFWMGIL